MDYQLSARVRAIKPFATIAVDNRAQELKAAGEYVIGLGADKPDSDTPEHIKTAARDAMDKGLTEYTAPDDTPSLKDRICVKLKRDNPLDRKRDSIVFSYGAKHSISG